MFLLEPKERTWGVLDVDKVPLPEGQTYLALLAQRPTDYLLYRARNPIDSTVSEAVLLLPAAYWDVCGRVGHVHCEGLCWVANHGVCKHRTPCTVHSRRPARGFLSAGVLGARTWTAGVYAS